MRATGAMTTGMTWNREVRQSSNSCRHGVGTMMDESGSVYKGDFRDDCRHGRGVLKVRKTVLYDGEWRDDVRWGSGRGIRTEGVYEGEWIADEPHGEGHMKYIDGRDYVGCWTKVGAEPPMFMMGAGPSQW